MMTRKDIEPDHEYEAAKAAFETRYMNDFKYQCQIGGVILILSSIALAIIIYYFL